MEFRGIPSVQSYDVQSEWSTPAAGSRRQPRGGSAVLEEELRRELALLQRDLLDACASQLAKQEHLIGRFADGLAQRCGAHAVAAAAEAEGDVVDRHPAAVEAPGPTAPPSPPAAAAGGPPGMTACPTAHSDVRGRPTLDGLQRGAASSRSPGASSSARRLWNFITDSPRWRGLRAASLSSRPVQLAVLSGVDQSAHVSAQQVTPQRSAVAQVVDKFSHHSWTDWLADVTNEPFREGCLAAFVDGHVFYWSIVFTILLNGVFILWRTNEAMDQALSGSKPTYFVELEVTFLLLFAVELVLKVAVHRVYFFIGRSHLWNLFDTAVVFVSLVDFLVTYWNVDTAMNLTFVRMCRLLKVSRFARIFRAIRFFKELRLLLTCLMNCFASLFWSCVLLLLVKFMFGLYFVMSMTEYLEDSYDTSRNDHDQIQISFGSVQVAMLTLLKSTSGGDNWTTHYDLLDRAGSASKFVFLFYIVFFMVAVWNIVTSVFIEKIMVLSGPSLEEEAFERRKRATEIASGLLELAHVFDKNKNGKLSLDEFLEGMENREYRSYFAVRGIDIKDGVTFFHMLATVNGLVEVPLEVFVHGCLRLRGPASSLDLHTFNYESQLTNRKAEDFQKYCSEQLNAQALQLSRLREDVSRLRA